MSDCIFYFLFSQVPKVAHTEFCQGRTMRWALAWSFCDDVIVPVSLCMFYFCPLNFSPTAHLIKFTSVSYCLMFFDTTKS